DNKPGILSSKREHYEILLRGFNSLRDSRNETKEGTDTQYSQANSNDKNDK
ncbi:18739_t:CDS:1, partial [Entrophospora sp. SA101]